MRAAIEVLEDELGLEIPVCGMVKNENIKLQPYSMVKIIKNRLGSKRTSVPTDSTVQREVHRFAITFHRQVRSKNTFCFEIGND